VIVLAFDQALDVTGWAAGSSEKASLCGRIITKPRRFDDLGMRFLRLERGIKDLIAQFHPGLIVLEEHRAHSSIQAAQVLGASSAIIMKCAKEANIPYAAVGVKTLKKFYTGTGSASKALMYAVARKRNPHLTIVDDNEADALGILAWGFSQLP
jgi:crossover junction endodeoxyribonuclease RuvC